MSKPQDRLNPECKKGPWSDIEEWGGKSWFPDKPVEEKQNGSNNTGDNKQDK